MKLWAEFKTRWIEIMIQMPYNKQGLVIFTAMNLYLNLMLINLIGEVLL